MLTAKLFASLAILLAVFGILLSSRIRPSMALDLYLHDTYYVVGPHFFPLLGALTCVILAFAYFAFGRWTARPLNQPIGLVSFACIAAAFVAWITVSLFARRDSLPSEWHIGALFGAIFSFLLGCVLFGGNLIWAIFRMIWSRFSFR